MTRARMTNAQRLTAARYAISDTAQRLAIALKRPQVDMTTPERLKALRYLSRTLTSTQLNALELVTTYAATPAAIAATPRPDIEAEHANADD